jgi:hypothetical protein
MPDKKNKKAEKKSVLDLIDEIIADIKNRWNQQEQLPSKYKEDRYGEVK